MEVADLVDFSKKHNFCVARIGCGAGDSIIIVPSPGYHPGQ